MLFTVRLCALMCLLAGCVLCLAAANRAEVAEQTLPQPWIGVQDDVLYRPAVVEQERESQPIQRVSYDF